MTLVKPGFSSRIINSNPSSFVNNFEVFNAAANKLFRYELLNEVTAEGIWDYDAITNKSTYNEAMVMLFGYTEAEMEDNKNWWESNIHPDDRKRVIDEMNETLASQRNTWYGEYLFRCKVGQYKPVLERLYIVRNNSGDALRLVGTMQDLSSLRQLHENFDIHKKNIRTSVIKAVLDTEENEKKVISTQLHENLNQILAAIHLEMRRLNNLIPESNKEELIKAAELLVNSMGEIRAISKQLYPVGIEIFGIEAILAEQLEQMREKSGKEHSIYIGQGVDSLGVDIQALLFKICIEQLKNICMHSNAKHVDIRIEKQNEKVKLTIADDGIGAENDQLILKTGFSKIQFFTEAYNGSYAIKTIPDKGFTLEVLL